MVLLVHGKTSPQEYRKAHFWALLFNLLKEWFPNTFMELNEDKCHLLTSAAKGDTEITIKIGDALIKESKE